MIKPKSTVRVVILLAIATGNAPLNASNDNAGFRADEQVTRSTPPGVTLVDAEHLPVASSARRMWTFLGNAQGETLFISDRDQAGVSHCTGACETEFPPLIALPDSQAFGDWSLLKRKNGSLQWMYKGKPLYRFAQETRFNEIVSNLVKAQAREEDLANGGSEQRSERDMRRTMGAKKDKLWNAMEFVEETSLQPPTGWQVAKFAPEVPEGVMPVDIALRDIPAISSVGLVSRQGMTLYAYDGNIEDTRSNCVQGCNYPWVPLKAAELSRPLGAFAPIRRANGDRQWSYKGAPLFTFKGDLKPGDANGTKRIRDLGSIAAREDNRHNGQWYIPVKAYHFMPANTQIRKERLNGDILSTDEGLPLYSHYRSEYITPNQTAYIKGRLAGTQGCDAECQKTWRPFLAPDMAQPQGHWEVFMREDGTRQWAYKGFAQYTHVNDTPYGRADGNQIYEPVIGDDGPHKVKDFVVNRFSQEWAQAIAYVWQVTKP